MKPKNTLKSPKRKGNIIEGHRSDVSMFMDFSKDRAKRKKAKQARKARKISRRR